MPGYNIEALERGIKAIKKNIQTFEDAIFRERQTITEYYDMIETVKRKQRESKTRDKLSKNVNS